MEQNNYPKLAQALKLFSVHCAETDNQKIDRGTMDDVLEKLYNTRSWRGFLIESLVPIQVSFGSHEDKEQNEHFPRVYDKMIMSWTPSRFYSGFFLIYYFYFRKAFFRHKENLKFYNLTNFILL